MKKLVVFLCVSAFCILHSTLVCADPILTGAAIEIPADAGTRFAGLEGQTSIWNKAATDGAAATGNVAILQGRMVTVTGDVAALQGQVIAQADTNETSDVTIYTPRFIGDVLVGGAGTGTNAVWIAKGATTNDWVAIKP